MSLLETLLEVDLLISGHSGLALRVLARALLAVRRLHLLWLAFHQGMCMRLRSSDSLPPATARRILSDVRHRVVERQQAGSLLLKLLHPFRRRLCMAGGTEVYSVRCLVLDLARVSLGS